MNYVLSRLSEASSVTGIGAIVAGILGLYHGTLDAGTAFSLIGGGVAGFVVPEGGPVVAALSNVATAIKEGVAAASPPTATASPPAPVASKPAPPSPTV